MPSLLGIPSLQELEVVLTPYIIGSVGHPEARDCAGYLVSEAVLGTWGPKVFSGYVGSRDRGQRLH